MSIADSHIAVDERELAAPSAHRSAREIRLDKVARILGCERSAVEAELRRRGETLLIETQRYPPMPDPPLEVALGRLYDSDPLLRRMA